MLKIRQAKIEDAELIEKISQNCFDNTNEVWSLEAIKFAIEDYAYKTYVAEKEEKIIGFIIMTYSPYEAYITQMAVDKNYQGLGYAYEILDYILKNISTEVFTLEVRSNNKIAVNLYEKCGFKQEGLRYNMYENPNEDAIVMTRKDDAC